MTFRTTILQLLNSALIAAESHLDVSGQDCRLHRLNVDRWAFIGNRS